MGFPSFFEDLLKKHDEIELSGSWIGGPAGGTPVFTLNSVNNGGSKKKKNQVKPTLKSVAAENNSVEDFHLISNKDLLRLERKLTNECDAMFKWFEQEKKKGSGEVILSSIAITKEWEKFKSTSNPTKFRVCSNFVLLSFPNDICERKKSKGEYETVAAILKKLEEIRDAVNNHFVWIENYYFMIKNVPENRRAPFKHVLQRAEDSFKIIKMIDSLISAIDEFLYYHPDFKEFNKNSDFM